MLAAAGSVTGCGSGGAGKDTNAQGGGSSVQPPTGSRAYYQTLPSVYGTFAVPGSPLGTLWLFSSLLIVRPDKGTFLYMEDGDQYRITGHLPKGASNNNSFYNDYDGHPNQWHSGIEDIRMFFDYQSDGTTRGIIYKSDKTILGEAIGAQTSNGFRFSPTQSRMSPSVEASFRAAQTSPNQNTSMKSHGKLRPHDGGGSAESAYDDSSNTYTNDPSANSGSVSIGALAQAARQKLDTIRNDPQAILLESALGGLAVAGATFVAADLAAFAVPAAIGIGAYALYSSWAATNGLTQPPLDDIDRSFIELGGGLAYEP